MISNNVQAIVLAAGKSSRCGTAITKLLMPVCGQELILYPLQALTALNIPITLVIEHQKEQIRSVINKYYTTITYIEQGNPQGTGHAVACTRSIWHKDHILVINGDMPLIASSLLQELMQHHSTHNAAVTLVTAHNADPSLRGYGRIIKHNHTITIIEDRHFKGNPADNCCVNAGIYIFQRAFLERELFQLAHNRESGELYITDLIACAARQNLRVETITASFNTIRGVNTLKELWTVEQIKKAELIEQWMQQGVYFQAPHTTHIDLNVHIGSNTIVGPSVQLLKNTNIGEHAFIGAFSILDNARLEPQVTIHPYTYIHSSHIQAHAVVGPFAHIRGQSTIGTASVIGNFVEISRTTFGQNSKAKHLSFLGDAQIGNYVNIGAGTITCNYNGVTKEKTMIGDHTHIGSNNALVAPVSIGTCTITGAGSTITDTIPDNALAIARARQITKEQYAPKLKERYKRRTTQNTSHNSESSSLV